MGKEPIQLSKDLSQDITRFIDEKKFVDGWVALYPSDNNPLCIIAESWKDYSKKSDFFATLTGPVAIGTHDVYFLNRRSYQLSQDSSQSIVELFKDS